MAAEYINLPGGCFVNDITHNLNGMTINTELLSAYGFETNQSATLLISQGQILITTDPIQSRIIRSIEELQFRHDEMDEDFEPAIYALLDLFTRRQKQ